MPAVAEKRSKRSREDEEVASRNQEEKSAPGATTATTVVAPGALPHLYLVVSKCQQASYDVATTARFEVHTYLDRAIDRARKIFVDHVNLCFRGGINSQVEIVKKKKKKKGGSGEEEEVEDDNSDDYDDDDDDEFPKFPCRFSVENVERISKEMLRKAWAQCDDCRTDCYGGVAKVEVIKMYAYDPSSSSSDLPGVEYHHHDKRPQSVVYSLPLKNLEGDSDDEEAADQEDSSSEEDDDSRNSQQQSSTVDDHKQQRKNPGNSSSVVPKPHTKELLRIAEREAEADALQVEHPVAPDEARAVKHLYFI